MGILGKVYNGYFSFVKQFKGSTDPSFSAGLLCSFFSSFYALTIWSIAIALVEHNYGVTVSDQVVSWVQYAIIAIIIFLRHLGGSDSWFGVKLVQLADDEEARARIFAATYSFLGAIVFIVVNVSLFGQF